jgi:hypothetical protein
MKKWSVRTLFALVLATLLGGIVYELETRVARGWLGGEAFFQGRPTSYWRAAIDRWAARFHPGDAVKIMTPPPEWGGDMFAVTMPEPKGWDRVIAWAQGDGYLQPLTVLSGDPGAEPVLAELESDAAMRPFVNAARRQADLLRMFADESKRQPEPAK